MLYGEKAAYALSVLRNEKKIYRDYLTITAQTAGVELVAAVDGLWEDVVGKIAVQIQKEVPEDCPHVFVWWYSVLLSMRKDAEVFERLVTNIRAHKEAFSPNTLYFLFYQLKSLLFRNPSLNSFRGVEELWKLFKELVEDFGEQMSCSLEPIPEEKRDSGRALVITEQFLVVQHGPTKTALDRCRALMVKLGKKVVLMNTTEAVSTLGEIPFLGGFRGNHPEKLENVQQQEWKDVQIPYYRCDMPMPDIDKLDELLREIRQMAPSIVVSIGGNGMLANLVNKMIPVLSVGLCPSDFEHTSTKYQALGRPLTEEDKVLLQHVGYNENHVIESVFTSSLKSQTEHITRREAGLPEDSFVMVVVGARLNHEVTDAFLEMIQSVLKENMSLVFVGVFENFETVLGRFPRLRRQAFYLGYCKDILSRMELCDLYLNPVRKGGGTSCVEAMFKGVPVISVDYGDVAVNSGKDFCVKDYSEMAEKIERYYKDTDFYRQMSEKAQKRAELLLDTEKEFTRIIGEMERREKEAGRGND